MSAKSATSNGLVYRLISVASLVGLPISFGVIGATALGDPVFGVVAGLMSGVGGHLFLPWVFQISTVQENADGEVGLGEAVAQVSDRPQRKVLGLGLDMGGIIMITIGLTLDSPTLIVGLAGGFAFAVLVYLAGSVALNRVVPAARPARVRLSD